VDQTGTLLQAPTLQHQTSLRTAITASEDVLADQLKEIVVQAKSAASRRENMDEDDEPIVPVVAVPVAPPASAQQAPQQDWQNLLRLLEENEKIGHLFRCARVQGLETVDGLLLFGKFCVFHRRRPKIHRRFDEFAPGHFKRQDRTPRN